MCPADSLYETWRQWRMNGRCACGPISTPIASISSLAPMEAAFFICSTLMLTTSNSAWVTTMRSQPASRDGRQRLAVGADDLDAFGSVLEVLDVVVGVEGRQPYDAPEAALHAPHPLHGLGVDPSRRPVEGDPAERLDARDVLAHEPGAVGRERDVVLEDDGFRLAGHVRLRGLVVVHGTAERVRRAVRVEVDQAFDRAHRGRRWREDASLGRCALHL